MSRQRTVKPSVTPPATSDSVVWIGVALLFVVTIMAYAPSLRGDFLWDDDDYVTNNPTLNDAQGLYRIWFEFGATRQFYPLVYTTFWIEKHVWGLNPIGFHVVNVLLHAAGAALLWRVLAALKVPGAFLAAVLFSLHPLHVESVAWITERKNVLSGVFYFAAALAYLQINNSRHSTRQYIVSMALFVCALLSKSVTCTLPAALLLVQWWRHGRISKLDIARLAPFFALGVALGLTTAWMENTHVGAGGPEWQRPIAVRLITAGRAFWFYLEKFVWPNPLIFVYPKWSIDSATALQFLFPFTALGLVAALFALRRRIGRGPIVAMLLYAGTILPALGFFNVYYAIRYSPVADHFAYLASVGPIVLVAAGLMRFMNRQTQGSRVAVVPGVVICIVLATLTWRQCGIYQNLETLWADTIRKNPSAGIAYLNLGSLRLKQGRNAEAVSLFKRSIELEPPTAIAHFNLGTALLNENHVDDAIENFRSALRLQADYPKCLANLGNAYLTKGRAADAVEPLRRAIELKPDYALAHQNLATAYEQLGRRVEAERHYREAVRFNPTDRASQMSAERLKRRP
ncbi:MAG: tetratricopeptide repeat protein [Planctomycetes bacterium]|nr:tetratricopeptide repeat protein [Planctomycetota bacterium]